VEPGAGQPGARRACRPELGGLSRELLLRQYFPKGSDLRAHGPGELAAVAAELNARPRKTLGWDTPAGRLGL
jgi:hypothetical protein